MSESRIDVINKLKVDLHTAMQNLNIIGALKIDNQIEALAREELKEKFNVDFLSTPGSALTLLESLVNKEKASIHRTWKVQTKTSDDLRSVEVSAVVPGTHGEQSWGWDDNETKIVVLRVDKLYQTRPIDQSIIDAAEAVAYNICVDKNSGK